MTTMTASQITDLHARRSAKGDGYAPTLAECLAAAAEGRLYDIDTHSAGADCLWIADDAETAIAECDAATGADGAGAWWTAERVTLIPVAPVGVSVAVPERNCRTSVYYGPDAVEVSTSAWVDGAEVSRVVRVAPDGSVTVTDTPQATGLSQSECTFVVPRGGGRLTVAPLTDREGPRVA